MFYLIELVVFWDCKGEIGHCLLDTQAETRRASTQKFCVELFCRTKSASLTLGVSSRSAGKMLLCVSEHEENMTMRSVCGLHGIHSLMSLKQCTHYTTHNNFVILNVFGKTFRRSWREGWWRKPSGSEGIFMQSCLSMSDCSTLSFSSGKTIKSVLRESIHTVLMELF